MYEYDDLESREIIILHKKIEQRNEVLYYYQQELLLLLLLALLEDIGKFLEQLKNNDKNIFFNEIS